MTRVGGGPAITFADNSLLSDRRLVNLLVETAKENKIPYQFKQAVAGGTDAGRITLVKEGVPSVAVAVPTRYIHSPVSLLSKHDFDNLVALMTKALPKLAKGLAEATNSIFDADDFRSLRLRLSFLKRCIYGYRKKDDSLSAAR